MDSSSDESFAWEKASSGSDDEDIKQTKINGTDIKVEHAQSYDNGEEEENMAKEPKAKKRKHRDKENSFDEVESPRKKKIKTEPESDSDARKNKKKNSEMSSVNGYFSNAHETDNLNDEEYLNMCVKQEQKSKKKQDDANDVDTSQEKEFDDHNMKKEKKKKKKKHSKDIAENIITENDSHNTANNSDYLDNSVEEMHEPRKKSSKKKKSKENRLSDRIKSHDQENESSSESPGRTKVHKNNDHVNMTKTNEYDNEKPIENNYSCSNSEDITQTQVLNSKNKTLIATLENGSPKKKISTIQTTPAGIQNNNPGRLLDRIRFEEDLDSDSDLNHISNETSSYLKKYLNQNENMQQISGLCQNGSEITNDDEIWILKCPHDIDIHKLHDTDFNLDSKSKIKINGETYCGNLDESESKITIMTSDTNNFIIKNIVANGTIHFRKRLPKPHAQQDNVMVNNQTDFISLPETKCRHPLFGSNYKEAIKVRVRRERVESATDLDMSTTHERKKKKKHKKEHCLKPKTEMDNDKSFKKALKVENDSDVPVKKAKKRKHTSNDESFKKQSKKMKVELDSAEAWESEKAIEENLFNF